METPPPLHWQVTDARNVSVIEIKSSKARTANKKNNHPRCLLNSFFGGFRLKLIWILEILPSIDGTCLLCLDDCILDGLCESPTWVLFKMLNVFEWFNGCLQDCGRDCGLLWGWTYRKRSVHPCDVCGKLVGTGRTHTILEAYVFSQIGWEKCKSQYSFFQRNARSNPHASDTSYLVYEKHMLQRIFRENLN